MKITKSILIILDFRNFLETTSIRIVLYTFLYGGATVLSNAQKYTIMYENKPPFTLAYAHLRVS
jgi:hypothetical protein